MWWASKRDVETLKSKLEEIEAITSTQKEMSVNIEPLREEIVKLAGLLHPKEPEKATLIKLLSSENQTSIMLGLRDWAFQFATDHWKWCLGVGGAGLALVVSSYFQWEANQNFSNQIKKQNQDTQIVRRAQLLNTIYEVSDCDLKIEKAKHLEKIEEAKQLLSDTIGPLRSKWTSELLILESRNLEICPPTAVVRLRQEAAVALARIEETKLDLNSAKLIGANLNYENLEGANLYGANLSRANLYGTILNSANLQDAFLYSTFLQGASLKGTHFFRAHLYDADLRRANLEGAKLENANLENADLSDANLLKAYLRNANLSSANFSGASLSNANLFDANLSNANLSNADLSVSVGLTQQQLDSANGDMKTMIPKRLNRPRHWQE